MMLAFTSKEEVHAFVVQDTKDMNERMKKNLKGTGATVKETASSRCGGSGTNQSVAVAGKVVPRLQ